MVWCCTMGKGNFPYWFLHMWFSHTCSIILQLYYLVSVGRGRDAGKLCNFYSKLPQPRNGTQSLNAQWMGSITRLLALDKGHEKPSVWWEGKDTLVSQDSGSMYHNEFPIGQINIIKGDFPWAILDVIMEWEKQIQQNRVECSDWRKILTSCLYPGKLRQSLNCTCEEMEGLKSTGSRVKYTGSKFRLYWSFIVLFYLISLSFTFLIRTRLL